jgi:general secretion pathway protein A
MYKHFFGLRENPFNVNPDPRFLYLTPQTQEALDELTFGIQSRKGLILLTGEVGTGKTTLINRLLDWLREQQTPTAFIFNSHLEISHLFDFILADFGVPFDPRLKDNARMRLNQWLFERFRAGDTPVMIVDEAQGLPIHVLEEIRMLLNLETPGEKLLQIVLVGQPELETRLKRPELRQIKQRITLRCKTAALTLEETHDYIQARLRIAGADGKPVFASQAMDAVHFYSRGIPRVINLLCEHALINAFVDQVRPVPLHIVATVAREFQFDDLKPVAPFIDSRNSLDLNLLATQSRFINGLVSLPEAAESHKKEPSGALPTHFSAPFAVHDTVLSLIKESGPPVLDCEGVPNVKGDVETSRPEGVQGTVPPPAELRRIETSRPSELTEFFSDVVNQFTSGLTTKPAPLVLLPPLHAVEGEKRFHLLPSSSRSRVSARENASRPPNRVDATKSHFLCYSLLKIITLRFFLVRWAMRGRDRFLSAFMTPARTQSAAIFLQRVRVSYRRCLAWTDRCLCMVSSIDWPQVKGSVPSWLRQPWSPTQLRFLDARLFEARRRFSYKKM